MKHLQYSKYSLFLKLSANSLWILIILTNFCLKTLAIHLDMTYWFPVYKLYFLLSLSCRPSSSKGRRQWRGWWEWILRCVWGRSRVYHCTSRPQISPVCIYCLAPVIYSHPSLSLNSLLIWVLLDLSVCVLCLPFLLFLTLWLSYALSIPLRRSGSNVSGISSELGMDDGTTSVRRLCTLAE